LHRRLSGCNCFHIISLFIKSLLLMLMFGCLEDAPHDNPLDPVNDFEGFEFEGRVLSFYEPRRSIAGASVIMQPGNHASISDADGFFRINGLNAGNYIITCTADGYHMDTMNLDLNENIQHQFLLDGLPGFRQSSITTHHRSRWFPLEETYFLEIETEATDPDGIGDIDYVVCKIAGIDFADTLQAALETGIFTLTLFSSDLPVTSIHKLIGQEFELIVADDYGIETSLSNLYLTRIIDEVPVIISPVELETVQGPTIRFQWQEIILPYASSFSIEIFQINLGIALKIDEVSGIDAGETEYTYESDLPAGDYFWTLNIVDEFGNSSSSREGVFNIQ